MYLNLQQMSKNEVLYIVKVECSLVILWLSKIFHRKQELAYCISHLSNMTRTADIVAYPHQMQGIRNIVLWLALHTFCLALTSNCRGPGIRAVALCVVAPLLDHPLPLPTLPPPCPSIHPSFTAM